MSAAVQSVDFYSGRKVAVLGLGRSGHTAALALHQGGAEVTAWDDGKRPVDAPYPLVDLNTADLTGVEALVISPGIPWGYPKPNPVAARAQAEGIPLICDVELLVRANPQARFVGITGTNGKSTCTALTAHLLREAGVPMAMGGNIGVPALALPVLPEGGVYVLELSSYQLELMQTPALDAALLLNISPDHLERHGGMPGYIEAKLRIFNQLLKPQGSACLGLDDAETQRLASRLPRLRAISGSRFLEKGVCRQAGHLLEDGAEVADLSQAPSLPGDHNGQNAAGAFALCRALGLEAAEIAPHFASFPGLVHRQERVASHQNLAIINDSKATNAEASLHALRAFPNIFWLLGGLPKDEGITPLLGDLTTVQQAYTFGQAAAEFTAQLSPMLATRQSDTLEQALSHALTDALAWARQHPEEPATLLLSPACASFDQFSSFEARGDAFRDLVTKALAAL